MMTLYEIWGKICSHQVTGLMYHFQFADMFYFLGLDNLGKNQECHYREESEALRKNHCFVLKHHSKILTQRHAEGLELIPSVWAKYSANDVDRSTRKSQVIAIFDNWATWEARTKNLYCEMYEEAEKQKAHADACRIKEMILDVEKELEYIQQCRLKLNMCDFSVESMLNL